MTSREPWQVDGSEAEFYEHQFVPALFGQWAPRVVAAAGVGSGDSVLDVATGTGIVARTAAEIVGETGSVIGYDLNEDMLEVAGGIAPHISWQQGPAESLPFDHATFDAVTCQFALMFFQDRLTAFKEMYRVLKPGKRIAVAVWDSLDRTPGYAGLVDVIARVCDEDVANILRAPFVLGEPEEAISLIHEAGLPDPEIDTKDGYVRFPSIRAWVYCDVHASPMARMLDEVKLEELLTEAEKALTDFTTGEGAVDFNSPAHILTVTKT